ncbi:MAG TPA: hypothetical protein GXZ56_04320 [Bacteroidales bacterium]|nr:hypothetical protein [Bacteroidales bacterium]
MQKNLLSASVPLLVSIPLLLSMLFSGTPVAAQTLSGTYTNGTDSLVFQGDQVMFRVSDFGGLSSVQTGMGTYEREGNFLLVHTTGYPGAKATFQELKGSREDTCVVKVVGMNNYPIRGILVEPDKVSRKEPGGHVTGNNGMIYLPNIAKLGTITVSGMGYNTVTIDYNPGYDYLVRLADYEVIEEKTVVFEFKEIDDETLSVILLTTEFNNDKKRDSELKKLERRARKNNLIDKRFKKEREPYVRQTHTGR